MSPAFPREPWRQRRPLVQLADPATQAEVGQRKHVDGLREQLHLPTPCGSRINAHVASILPHGQHAAAMLVQFVDLAFAGQCFSVAVRNNLGRKIEAVDVMLVRGEHDIDHDHIRFGIVIRDRALQIESPPR